MMRSRIQGYKALTGFIGMAVRWVIVTGAAVVVLALLARFGVIAWSAGRIHTLEETPERRVAIVFGAQVYPSGQPSAMLADRVATGADLYHQGKVDVLLLTGDNRTMDYNEPAAMREYALSLGVPDEAIVLDYGGRRTYDSCYRARYIFGVTDAIAVTQQFHLSRAVMTCTALGIDTVGVAADYQRSEGYRLSSLRYSQIRELPATANALIDVLRKNQPPVMGEPLPIFPHEG
jgi:SanA protein